MGGNHVFFPRRGRAEEQAKEQPSGSSSRILLGSRIRVKGLRLFSRYMERRTTLKKRDPQGPSRLVTLKTLGMGYVFGARTPEGKARQNKQVLWIMFHEEPTRKFRAIHPGASYWGVSSRYGGEPNSGSSREAAS